MKTNKHYDIIPDIHGHHDKLTALLDVLGYERHADHYRHPEGRKVIFLGDFIDRGPKIRETLELVRAMVDAGEARAIMGNHELNAVFYHTPDGKGGHLKEHAGRNVTTHAATLEAFKGRGDEWTGWIDWFKRLPFYLDFGDLRAVHAAWAPEHIEFLRDKTLLDDGFLRAAATKGTREHLAIEVVLKGPEMKLPDGMTFFDNNNIERDEVRVRWWDIAEGTPIGDLVMPEPMENVRVPLRAEDMTGLPNYPADAPPVFVGHYWRKPTAPKEPMAGNIVVLDYGAGLGTAPLVAYRWDGEAKPTADNFVVAPTS